MSKRTILLSGILALILVYLICCMFAPSAYSYKDEIKVSGPYKMAFVIVNDMRDWPKWFSWNKSDPDIKIMNSGRDVNVGAYFSFDGKMFGKGYVEQTEGFQDSIISVDIKASKIPNALKVGWQIITEGKRNFNIHLNARLVGKIPFIKRAYYYGLQNKLNRTFHEDLVGMKTYIEDLVKGDFGVEKTTFNGQKYFGKLDITTSAKIPDYYAKYYPKIYHLLDSLNVKVIGPPVGLIYYWEAKTGYVAIMAALPIDVKTPFISGFSYIELEKSECLLLKNFGNYKTLRNAHAKMNYLMDDSPYTLAAPIIEEYVTSPSQEPDTLKWQTNIYYLLDSRGGYIKTMEKKQTLEDLIKMEDAAREENLKNMLREVK